MQPKILSNRGGGLDRFQSIPGQMAEFNIWNREMGAREADVETCGTVGDVVSWSTLKVKGNSAESEDIFPACFGEAA